MQWQFNDTDRTVKNQNTGNVRGEAVESIRPGVLASKDHADHPRNQPPAGDRNDKHGAAPLPPTAGPSILATFLAAMRARLHWHWPRSCRGTTSRDPAGRHLRGVEHQKPLDKAV